MQFSRSLQLSCLIFEKNFGDYSGEVTPLPIPNREVKLTSANDTMWVAAWKSRSLPDFIL